VFKLRLALKGLATGPMKSSVRQRAECADQSQT
jgi:hypothetical protein